MSVAATCNCCVIHRRDVPNSVTCTETWLALLVLGLVPKCDVYWPQLRICEITQSKSIRPNHKTSYHSWKVASTNSRQPLDLCLHSKPAVTLIKFSHDALLLSSLWVWLPERLVWMPMKEFYSRVGREDVSNELWKRVIMEVWYWEYVVHIKRRIQWSWENIEWFLALKRNGNLHSCFLPLWPTGVLRVSMLN